MSTQRKTNRGTSSPERKRVALNINEPSDRQRLVEEFFEQKLVGQPGLRNAAVRAYARGISVLKRNGRPIYVVFALGKRGTGKTFTPSKLAEFIHGDETALIKIKCGAYKEPHRVAQLLGAPPSYVGYKDPDDTKSQTPAGKMDKSAKLTRHNIVASRKGSDVPISLIVVDEVEKAIEELEDVLLSIMWEAEVDLGNNETTDFSDCIIWLTGNVAADQLEKLGKVIGFIQPKVEQGDIEDTVESVLKSRYKPEFLDRIDEIVIAEQFEGDQMRQMVEVHINEFRRRMEDSLPRGKQFDLVVEPGAVDFILKKAKEDSDSARGIVRTIEKYLSDPLGNELTKNTITLGDRVEVAYEEGNEALSFYLLEGEGTVSDADKMAIFGNRDTGVGLGMQRRTARANALAKKQTKKRYSVTIEATSDNKLAAEAATIQHEAKEIFGLSIKQITLTTDGEPHSMTFIVEGIQEQIELFSESFKDAKVAEVKTPDGEAA